MNLRSLLYVPADNLKFVQKAHLRGADALILDLEDAVKAAAKTVARDHLAQSVAACGQAGAKVFVRINSDKATAFMDAEAAFFAGATGLYVPKASVKRLRQLDRLLGALEGKAGHAGISLIALIENAKGVLQARKIAGQNRVIALTLGAEDFANDIGATAEPEVLFLPKQMVHLAAKSRNLLSLGLFRTVADYADISAIQAAATKARRYGFDGASCVHPDVVPLLNKAFTVSTAELSWARAVVQKAAGNTAGAFEFDGKMVDKPLLERAKKIILNATLAE